MATRRPNVPRTGASTESRRSGENDVATGGATRADAPRPSPARPSSARPARPVTSALPVTPHSAGETGAGAGDGGGGDGAGPARLMRGLRGSTRVGGGRGRGRKNESATSTTPTRYTVSREDGRVNYAFTDRALTDAPARPAASGSSAVRPVPAKAFSGRLLALALVLVTITILLAPTVRTFLAQRAEISSLQQGIEDERAQQAQLKDQLARWNDPAYVKQQARDRLFYVMPGETGYLVIGADSTDEIPPVATSAESDDGPQPWLDALWTTVEGSAAQQQDQQNQQQDRR